MGRGAGVVVAGIILSITGIAIAGVCAKPARDEFKKQDKYKEGEITLKDSSKISIEVAAGTVNLHHSDTTTSYVKYNILEHYEVKYDEEDNELKLRNDWIYSLLPFSWIHENKSVVDIYLTDKEYDAYLELSAGHFNIEEDFTFSSLTMEVSAGDLNFNGNITVNHDATFRVSAGNMNLNKRVIVNNNLNLKVSAGDMDINYVEANKTDIRISAGDIDLKKIKSNDIKFKASAGDLKMNILGKKDDYTITMDRSAGTIHIDGEKIRDDYEKKGGTNKLDGDISAGNATINFISED